MTLATALQFTSLAEGGYTHDTGGDTMRGITQSVYDAYRRRNNEPLMPVRTIQVDEISDIQESQYWVPAHCADLTEKMGIAHFDFAYNAGVSRSIRTLQRVAGCVADGVYGPVTRQAMQAKGDTLLQSYLDARRTFYNDLVASDPDKYAMYLHGWLNRVDNLERYLR